MDNKIKVQIFGSFTFTNGEVVLTEEEMHSRKIMNLLAYLVIHRDNPVTSERLSEQFWGDRSKNPEGALKNMMYRLRNVLKKLGPEEYICTLTGAYKWNPEIKVETDYEQFEKWGMGLSTEENDTVRKDLCRKMIDCYKGNISSKISGEPWILLRAMQYQSMYIDAVKMLGDIYEKEQEWAELELFCQNVLTQEPLDEDVHCWLIKSLHKQEKYDQALQQYDKAKKQLYDNYGLRTSEKLQKKFQEIMSVTGKHITNIEELSREMEERDRPIGTFFCDYQIFRQIFRLEARRIGRMGISEYILLLTLRRPGGVCKEAVTDSGLREGAEILEQVMRESLRIGDVVSQCGPTQYVVLLTSCSYEAGISVARRIRSKFSKRTRKRRLELQYELEAVTSSWLELEEHSDK